MGEDREAASSTDTVDGLRARVSELEQQVEAQQRRIVALSREIPQGLAHRKTARLGLEPKMLAQPGDGTGGPEWPAHRVRDTYIQFFEGKKAHTFWRSSPVVPHNDPTLLFTNAGMNQYKPLFLGQADPNTEMSKLTRAVNTQKCIRAGGKHNDLEDVGKDVYHHTFFEMLGNWSFGDYFKEEAIDWAWELLTEVFKLPKEQLYASYFMGSDTVPEDTEARRIWLKHLPAERVLPFDAKDNFWEMGDTGPCGPCSEIHFDRIGGGRDASSLVNADDPDVVEIWNLVFIQFNRKPGGALEPLPAKHVDTGMGFERLVSALQNVTSNYDTDLFAPIFRAVEAVAGVGPYSGKVGAADEGNVDMAYRVVADHIRTLSFAIADGAFPSNEGRGYVLRRVLRRAVRYGMEVLKMPLGAFSKLTAVVVAHWRETFPELADKERLIYDTLLDEEETFARTLRKGTERFNREAAKIKAAGGTALSGKLAFFLYQSMGFPVDLTQLMAEEQGLSVDIEGYEAAFQAHQARSQMGNAGTASDGTTVRKLEAKETAYLDEGLQLKPTDHSALYTWHEDVSGAKVQAIFDGDKFVDRVTLAECEGDRQYGFVLDKTNFYYESGGQAADTGALRVEGTDVEVSVRDCQSSKGFIVHAGVLRKREASDDDDDEDESEAKRDQLESREEIRVGDIVTCKVDFVRRGDMAKNHTATHLLNFALREAVSRDVDQKGSQVTEAKLRFDFNSPKAVPLEQLLQVEQIVRDRVAQALPVHTAVVPLADAKRISALRAVFGETYPDPVRVVTVGPRVEEVIEDPLNEKWAQYSVELCGGTHLTKSSEARAFALVSEGALAKGIRRVVCVTGEAAFAADRDAEALRARVDEAAGLSGEALAAHYKALHLDVQTAVISVSDKHALQQSVEAISRRLLAAQKAEQAALTDAALAAVQAAASAGAPFVVHMLAGSGSQLTRVFKDVVAKTKARPVPTLLVQANADADAVAVAAFVPSELEAKMSPEDWGAAAGKCVDAQGGGKGTTYNARGAGADKAQAVVDAAVAFAQEKLL